LLDPAGGTLDLFEINKIPAILIIDKKGKMIGRAIGPRNWSSLEVFPLIDQWLDDRPSRAISLRGREGTRIAESQDPISRRSSFLTLTPR